MAILMRNVSLPRTPPPARVNALLSDSAVTTVTAAQLPRAHAAMHLDTVFTPCAPEVVTDRPEVVDKITCLELELAAHGQGLQVHAHAGKHLLDVLAETLGVPTLRAIARDAVRYR
jgi:arginine deiminase